jgi:hypothetical protein
MKWKYGLKLGDSNGTLYHFENCLKVVYPILECYLGASALLQYLCYIASETFCPQIANRLGRALMRVCLASLAAALTASAAQENATTPHVTIVGSSIAVASAAYHLNLGCHSPPSQ